MQEITNAHASLDPAAYKKAIEIADEALRRGYEIDRSAASRLLGEMIADAVAKVTESPIPARTKSAMALIEIARRLRADSHFFRAQEIFFQAIGERTSWPAAIPALAIGLGFAPTVVGRRDSLIMQLQAESEAPLSAARSRR
jgi:hypothetical protein